jgi:RimJ/RimL family protein N-acetyltransferase
MPGAPTLTDGTLTLRAHRADDVEAVVEQSVDPASVRWTTVPTPYGPEDARRFVGAVMPDGWDHGRWGFAVEAEGRYAGTVELRDEGDGRAEVAFGSHPSVRGRGLMERAVRLLVDWGFDARDVQVVVWRANRGNWASRKLAWRLGFTFEGTIRRTLPQRGELRDAWVGTLLASDRREPKGRWLDVPVCEGDGLRLRPLREADVPRVVEACADEQTQHWLGRMPDPYGEADAREWLEHCRENAATGDSVQWAVVDQEDDDRLLAAMSCFGLVPEVECEIGYWSHPDARGRGVVTRAMGTAMRHAFEGLGVRRVSAGAAVDNAASRRVIEANGLRQSGVERLGTTIRTGRADIAWYDVLIEEWRASRAG